MSAPIDSSWWSPRWTPRRTARSVARTIGGTVAVLGLTGALIGCGAQGPGVSPAADAQVDGVRQLIELDYGPWQLADVRVGEEVDVTVEVEDPRIYLEVCSGDPEVPGWVEVEFLDAQGEPIAGPEGALIWRWDYEPGTDDAHPQGCNIGLDGISLAEQFPGVNRVRITEISGVPTKSATVTVF